MKYLNFNTVHFNLKYFPLSVAYKLPVLVSKNTFLKTLEGEITLPTKIYPGLIKIGFGDIGIFDKQRSRSILELGGKIHFKGSANIGHGSKISVGEKGELILGDNFAITAEAEIICFNKISFGSKCLLSWNVMIMDTDFHRIFESGEWINKDEEINIGNGVWIGARCTVLKGIHIADGSVIAANSVVVKSLKTQNALYAGNPASLKKEFIQWEI